MKNETNEHRTCQHCRQDFPLKKFHTSKRKYFLRKKNEVREYSYTTGVCNRCRFKKSITGLTPREDFLRRLTNNEKRKNKITNFKKQ